jgi:hypothetical protein
MITQIPDRFRVAVPDRRAFAATLRGATPRVEARDSSRVAGRPVRASSATLNGDPPDWMLWGGDED